MPPPPVRFDVPPYDFAAADQLAGELGVSRVLAQVLVRRGFASADAARRFLDADVAHPLHAFGGLREGARAILAHVSRRSRITVHGDYDVDGVCSSAILIRALRSLGADVDWYLPSRTEDGYGLAAATVERLAARGTDLIVTADCAITAVEEVAAARAAGVDVVVTDHHAPRADGRLPDAPIVHPRIGDYPCPDLCAAGVAYKLAGALLEQAGHDPALADADLDLVALATVADVVSLQGENRRLVREGLRAMATTAKPGLRALMAVSKVDPSGLDAQAIGFRLAPRINAAGRLHRADAGLELVLTADEERARAIADELDALNHERRDVETRMRFEAEAMARELGPDVPAYVLASEGWHPGVIGIVASRIAERYHRPAVLIALDGEEGTGSGRSIAAFDLLGGLTAASDDLLRYGGHRAAAGLTIARNRVDAFREAFCAHAAAVLRPEDLVRTERVDAIVPGGVLDIGLAEELERLEPVGCGNPPVTLLVPAAMCDDPRPMGEGRHLAFTLAAGGARSRCVSFGRGTSLPAEPGCPVDGAGRPEVNPNTGSVEPRLVLRHAAPPCPAPIELVGEPASFAAGVLDELDRDLWSAGAPAPLSGAVAAERMLAAAPAAADRTLAAAPAAADRTLAAAPAATTVDDLAPWAAGERAVRDVRGAGIAGVIADLVASGEPVLVLAAHAPHRARALAQRVGGFALASYAALAADPQLAAPYPHVVALDPPPHAVCPAGAGHTHLAWGEAELGFARRIHHWEYALRDPLATVYRALRASAGASGEALEAILRGEGTEPRSGALAGRLVRVLSELGLVHLDRAGPALTVAEAPARTALERSAAYRAYHARLEDGLRYLKTPHSAEATRAA